MSEQIIERKTAVELDEQELDIVVGGFAQANGGAGSFAFGPNFASTVNQTTGTAIQVPGGPAIAISGAVSGAVAF